MDCVITDGFSLDERPQIAALYWDAFAVKLRIPMGPPKTAQQFIIENLNPDFALVARDDAGAVLGMAGFKTAEGAFIQGGLRDLAKHYGWLSTIWRVPLLSMMERSLSEDTLLMDGICVGSTARGRGVGTALLHAMKDKAAVLGLPKTRLGVIDTNPRARALYEREGFVALQTESLGLFRHVFGFNASTTMVHDVSVLAK